MPALPRHYWCRQVLEWFLLSRMWPCCVCLCAFSLLPLSLLKIQVFSLFVVAGILELLLYPCGKGSAALAWTDGRGKGGRGGGGLINNSFAAGRARGDPIPEPFLPSFQSTPFVSLTLSSFAIAAVVLPILPLLAFPQSVVGHWKAKKDISAYLSSSSQKLE